MSELRLVTPPTITDTAKAESVEMLEEILARAKLGEVDSLFIVASFTSGKWADRVTPSADFPSLVGRVHIALQKVIDEFRG